MSTISLLDEGQLTPTAVSGGGTRRKILILGGSTSIGLITIQLCKNYLKFGQIYVTSSQEQLCKSLGATKVFNYKLTNDENIWYKSLKDEKIDVIFDCVGGLNYDLSIKYNVLKNGNNGGQFITVTNDFEGMPNLTFGVVFYTIRKLITRKFCSYFFGYPKYIMPFVGGNSQVAW